MVRTAVHSGLQGHGIVFVQAIREGVGRLFGLRKEDAEEDGRPSDEIAGSAGGHDGVRRLPGEISFIAYPVQ